MLQMIASIGNGYAASSLVRTNTARSAGTRFDASTSVSPSAAGQTVASPTGDDGAAAPAARDTDQPDFTSMTRQQLRDWTNDQIKSGSISFDDGTALALMSGRMPVEGTSTGDEALATEKLDFIGLARDGIAGAQSRHDQKAVDRLQKALTMMGDRQTSPGTDDISTADSSIKLKEAHATFRKAALPTPDSEAAPTS